MESTKAAVDYVASQSGEWLRRQSQSTLLAARGSYSLSAFKKRFAEIISELESGKQYAG